MKTKVIIVLTSLFLLSSCGIVKSLKAFYIPEVISFQETFIGEWTDKKNVHWKVVPFKDAFGKGTRADKGTTEDIKVLEEYQDGYFVQYGDEDSESLFVAMSFTIDGTIFIDFVPVDFRLFNKKQNLIKEHLIKTHSVAKFDVLEDQKIKITWLDEDRLGSLFEHQKIQIKHEIIGFDETLLLTASSKELYRFLKKYNASNIKDKWKSDKELVLTPVHAKP